MLGVCPFLFRLGAGPVALDGAVGFSQLCAIFSLVGKRRSHFTVGHKCKASSDGDGQYLLFKWAGRK